MLLNKITLICIFIQGLACYPEHFKLGRDKEMYQLLKRALTIKLFCSFSIIFLGKSDRPLSVWEDSRKSQRWLLSESLHVPVHCHGWRCFRTFSDNLFCSTLLSLYNSFCIFWTWTNLNKVVSRLSHSNTGSIYYFLPDLKSSVYLWNSHVLEHCT